MRQELADNLYHAPRFQKKAAISIGTVRKIQREASYKPYEGRRRVFVLAEADKMTEEAANALLKILEEPPSNTLFVLTTAQPNKLPTTVLSRCQQIRFSRLSEADVAQSLEKISSVDSARRRLISRLAQGDLDRARELLREDVERKRSAALSILTTALSGDMLSVIKLAEGLGRTRDPSVHQGNLETLQIWYRDLLLVLEGKEDLLINQDLKSRLVEMASQYDWEGVQRALSLIQETQRALAANVNFELVWMVLLFKLRRQRRVQS